MALLPEVLPTAFASQLLTSATTSFSSAVGAQTSSWPAPSSLALLESLHPSTAQAVPPTSPGVTTGLDQWREPVYARTIFTIVLMVWMLVLSVLIGLRFRQLVWHKLFHLQLPLIHYLTTALYVFSITFIWVAAVLISCVGLRDMDICRGAIYVCLAMYFGSKVLMYVFLVERAHAIRAPHARRCNDYVYVFFMFCILAGFSTCAAFAFLRPNAGMTAGRCDIGVPRIASITLVVYDVVINFSLTGVFIWLLQPFLNFGRPMEMSYWKEKLTKWLGPFAHRLPCKIPRPQTYRQSMTEDMVRRREWLVWKSLIATCLVVMPTVINLAINYKLNGKEMGWFCLLLCSSDVTWAVCVIHWLTAGLIEAEEEHVRSTRPISTARPLPLEAGLGV